MFFFLEAVEELFRIFVKRTVQSGKKRILGEGISAK